MSKHGLKISDDVTLPIELATRRSAIFGISGSGKSNTATRCIELLLDAGEQVVMIDPKGEGWGLQTSADGKSAAYDIIVFGQPRGDIPELKEEHAEQVADFVVDSGRSVVLSLLGFDTDQAERRFVTNFFKRLYRRKSQQPVKTRTLVVLEEAHLFVPENASGATGEMVGAIKRIARQGRSAGIGLMVVDQRPQEVAKSIISQTELLICHQLVHNLDIAALRDWIKAYDTKNQSPEFLNTVAMLPQGKAWVWSPAWLHLFIQSQMYRRKTYDSGATPDGSPASAPKAKATVDLDKLRAHLAKVVEQAKENDPALLKKQVAQLRAELTKAQNKQPKAETKIVEKPVVTDAQVKGIERTADKLTKEGERRIKIGQELTESGNQLVQTAKEFIAALRRAENQPAASPGRTLAQPVRRALPMPVKPEVSADAQGRDALSGPEKKILDAIAWMESIGISQPEQTAVAFLAGYTYGGGGFNNPRGALNTKGLVNYVGGGLIELTDAGRAVASHPGQQLTNEKMREKVLSILPGPESRILVPLMDAYPNEMTNEDLAAAAEYTYGSGGYNNPRGRLRTLGLIEYTKTGVRARDLLFPEAVEV